MKLSRPQLARDWGIPLTQEGGGLATRLGDSVETPSNSLVLKASVLAEAAQASPFLSVVLSQQATGMPVYFARNLHAQGCAHSRLFGGEVMA